MTGNDVHTARTAGASGSDGEQTNRACSDHRDMLTKAEPGEPDCPHANSQWLGQRCHRQTHFLGERVKTMRRDLDKLGKTAGQAEADHIMMQ